MVPAVKPAVIKHQTAVESTGGRTHGGAHEAGGQSGTDPIASYDGAEAGGKGHAVYVALGRDGPGDLPAVHAAEHQGHQI